MNVGLGKAVNVMQKTTYDTNEDLIVDRAEGIRDVAEFPADPKKGDLILKNGELYVCTETD